MRPEDYWIGLGENVIGYDVLEHGEHARQWPTYKAILDTIHDLGITNLLDVGSNYAILGHLLEGSGVEYLGIDSNPFAIKRALRITVLGDIRKLKIDDELWQCVVCKDVIEHLENIEPLREVFRVANQYVIIATYLVWHDAPSVIIQHPDGYYTNTYNRDEVEMLAESCGFELIDTIATKETNGTPNEVTVWERKA